jgi:hypothetical protein
MTVFASQRLGTSSTEEKYIICRALRRLGVLGWGL